MSERKDKAVAAVKGLLSGGPDRALLADNFSMWAIGGRGKYDAETLIKLTAALRQLFKEVLYVEILFAIEEGEWVALRVHAEAIFNEGGTYENDYLYAVRFSNNLICEMQEFMNNSLVDSEIRPRLQKLMAQQNQA